MRKIIDGLAYDTEKAELVHDWSNSYPSSDFHAREWLESHAPAEVFEAHFEAKEA